MIRTISLATLRAAFNNWGQLIVEVLWRINEQRLLLAPQPNELPELLLPFPSETGNP
jgi:hypothetical protein